MLFNSFKFAIFLPIVFIIFWKFPAKYRWLILLISSYIFYMGWNWKCIILIFGVTVIAYSGGILIEKWRNPNVAKNILVCCIAINLAILFVFKYFNFFTESIVLIGGGVFEKGC